jgi:hypothetical protein
VVPEERQILEVAWMDPHVLRGDEVSAFLLPLLEQERTGADSPIHYRAEHARMSDGTLRPILL